MLGALWKWNGKCREEQRAGRIHFSLENYVSRNGSGVDNEPPAQWQEKRENANEGALQQITGRTRTSSRINIL